MRVLMTTDTIGGVWTYSQELTEELLRRGVAVALVSFGRSPSPAQTSWFRTLAARWGPAFSYEASAIPLEWMSRNEETCHAGDAILLRVAGEFGAQLLHSNQFCFGALPSDLPRLVVAHSDVLSWSKQCRVGALAPSAWLDRYCTLVQRGLHNADVVVAPTHWMLGALTEHFVIRRDAYVIPNGRTLLSTRNAGPRKLQAVSAGRLWDEGKHLKLLEKVETRIPILLAGEKDHDTNSLSISAGKVTLLGRLDQEDLLALLRDSAIYLCTSRYEPFGLAPLEAALCGCAVLANDIPSLREVWQDSALFFKDAASLSALLERLAARPSELMAAQQRSLRRGLQFTAQRMAEEYLALYRTVAAQPKEMHVA